MNAVGEAIGNCVNRELGPALTEWQDYKTRLVAKIGALRFDALTKVSHMMMYAVSAYQAIDNPSLSNAGKICSAGSMAGLFVEMFDSLRYSTYGNKTESDFCDILDKQSEWLVRNGFRDILPQVKVNGIPTRKDAHTLIRDMLKYKNIYREFTLANEKAESKTKNK